MSDPEDKAKYFRQYRKLNPDKDRKYNLKRRYGLTLDQYHKLLDDQNGVCAICLRSENRYLAVDHCHETGEIRGLLCTHCNLSTLGHPLEKLQRAVEYLTKTHTGIFIPNVRS